VKSTFRKGAHTWKILRSSEATKNIKAENIKSLHGPQSTEDSTKPFSINLPLASFLFFDDKEGSRTNLLDYSV
jgi:hypothetical protein